MVTKDSPIAKDSAKAPVPPYIDTNDRPFWPSLGGLSLEPNPHRPIQQSALPDSQRREVVERGVLAVEASNQGCCDDSNGGNSCQNESGNGKTVGQWHSIGLLLTQGDGGAADANSRPALLKFYNVRSRS